MQLAERNRQAEDIVRARALGDTARHSMGVLVTLLIAKTRYLREAPVLGGTGL